eukprot:scaffold6396_cov72-Phaeocystis_antarctica.AAC.3
MSHLSVPLRSPPTSTNNGLSFQDSPCVMSFKDSHAVGPFGGPYRTTNPLSRKASKHQSKTVSLRLSPNHGLAHARNHSSHAPRTQPAPNGAPPMPAPRAQRTYRFCATDGRLAAACDATKRTAAHTAAPAVPTTGAFQASQATSTPPEGQNVDRQSQILPQKNKRQAQTKPCNDTKISAARSTVAAVCCSNTTGGAASPPLYSFSFEPRSQAPAYTWLPTHAAWNLLRRIEQGNTTTAPQNAHALRRGDKIAVWWTEPDPATHDCWYTAKVVDTTTERSNQHTVQYDRDNTIHTHVFMPRFLQNAVDSRARWTPAPPTYTPPCPACGGPTRGGTGAGTGRLSYTCDTCGA